MPALCGLAGAARPGMPKPIYATPEELLAKTEAFNAQLWSERLNGYFGGVQRYLAVHFGGVDPYSATIAAHLRRIAALVRDGRLDELRLRPVAINRERLREILDAERNTTPAPRALAHAA